MNWFDIIKFKLHARNAAHCRRVLLAYDQEHEIKTGRDFAGIIMDGWFKVSIPKTFGGKGGFPEGPLDPASAHRRSLSKPGIIALLAWFRADSTRPPELTIGLTKLGTIIESRVAFSQEKWTPKDIVYEIPSHHSVTGTSASGASIPTGSPTISRMRGELVFPTRNRHKQDEFLFDPNDTFNAEQLVREIERAPPPPTSSSSKIIDTKEEYGELDTKGQAKYHLKMYKRFKRIFQLYDRPDDEKRSSWHNRMVRMARQGMNAPYSMEEE
jgi:hypothetical protein